LFPGVADLVCPLLISGGFAQQLPAPQIVIKSANGDSIRRLTVGAGDLSEDDKLVILFIRIRRRCGLDLIGVAAFGKSRPVEGLGTGLNCLAFTHDTHLELGLPFRQEILYKGPKTGYGKGAVLLGDGWAQHFIDTGVLRPDGDLCSGNRPACIHAANPAGESIWNVRFAGSLFRHNPDLSSGMLEPCPHLLGSFAVQVVHERSPFRDEAFGLILTVRAEKAGDELKDLFSVVLDRLDLDLVGGGHRYNSSC